MSILRLHRRLLCTVATAFKYISYNFTNYPTSIRY